jgi:DNA ligase (NAD+)
LTHVDGIGPVLAQSLVDFWSEPANVAIVDEILATGVVVFDASGGSAPALKPLSSASPSPSPTPTPAPRLPERGAKINPAALKSMKILFTGVVPDRSRDEIHDVLRSAGASLTSSLSPKTTLLLVGQSAGPTKLNKARELGVPIVDARVFLDALVNGDDPLASF